MAQIQEKLKELPDDVGEDFSKAESFHRMHAAFERDITALGRQVRMRSACRPEEQLTLVVARIIGLLIPLNALVQ